jgi:TetR/AcrR family transcriptional regulator
VRYQEGLERVLEASARLFADRGYHRSSVRDIARATGLTTAGLYYYFKSKEDLLFLTCDHILQLVEAGLDAALAGAATPEERLARFVRNHLETFSSHMPEMKVLAHESAHLQGESLERLAAKKRQYFLRCAAILGELRGGPGDDGSDLRTATMALFGMLNWIYTWYRPGRDPDAQALAAEMTRLFLRGFLAPPLPDRQALP